ncbi:MAG: hypothetical protein KBD16_00875 [Candidatus Pacebacteria bacterium]|nr:hypothetical protein [Candidatus Paceibacterota bacterium]
MSWSSRRRSLYFLIFFVVVVAIVGGILYSLFYEAPTCTDGIQNGMEEGVDCGGGCPIICSFSAAEPIVHFSRLFEIIPGVYTVLALVENPNPSVAAYDLPYTFKLRGADSLLVSEQKGKVYLPATGVVPVFVTGVQTGSRIPTRVEFALGEPVWTTETPNTYDLSIDNIDLSREDSAPRLTARVTNHSLDSIETLPLVAVLYDTDQNSLHASRTILKNVPGDSTSDLVFTWPEAFTVPVGRIEIIPIPQELK